ncbi:MAG: histidine phosphatase family protein, partial [Candidatus Micrarchaeia archaeon]
VYFSPLIRAKQTAEIAFGHRDMPMSASPELLERDFGLLDGMTLEEAKTKFPNIEDFYLGKIIETSVPGLEKIPVLQDRSVTAIRKLAYENKGKTIALVGHLFWIKSALSKILGVPFEEIQKKSVANCSITTLEAIFGKDVSFEVKDIGDKRHLQGLTKPKE